MKLSSLLTTLDTIAPRSLAADWDNVGLLAGDPDADIANVLLTIDATDAVLDEALQRRAELILCYHPPIFKPLTSLTADDPRSRLVYRAIRNGMHLYAMHTALDVVPGGRERCPGRCRGYRQCVVLRHEPPAAGRFYKLVVFVPHSHIEEVSDAVFSAGAGRIADDSAYSQCSFRTTGTGTFTCGPESQPAIGVPGSTEHVEEVRFETVVPAAHVAAVLSAMAAAHPYEEPAWDLFSLVRPDPSIGLGRAGDLSEPVELSDLLARIKTALAIDAIGLIGPADRIVRRAAVGAGSCGDLYRDVIAADCDFYLTGELRHHDALACQAAGLTVACVSHSNSERLVLPIIAERLTAAHSELTCTVSTADHDPFSWRVF